jgi:hypothetical protein
MDLAKRDMTLHYQNRTFSLRAYANGNDLDGPSWHTVIVENRTPLSYEQEPQPGPTGCFAEAVRFLVAMVDLQTGVAASW